VITIEIKLDFCFTRCVSLLLWHKLWCSALFTRKYHIGHQYCNALVKNHESRKTWLSQLAR